jgi:predicted phage tail protein
MLSKSISVIQFIIDPFNLLKKIPLSYRKFKLAMSGHRVIYRRFESIEQDISKLNAMKNTVLETCNNQAIMYRIERDVHRIERDVLQLIKNERQYRIKADRENRKKINGQQNSLKSIFDCISLLQKDINNIQKSYNSKIQTMNDLDELIAGKIAGFEKTLESSILMKQDFERIEHLSDDAKKAYTKYMNKLRNAIESEIKAQHTVRRLASVETRITLLEKLHGSGEKAPDGTGAHQD